MSTKGGSRRYVVTGAARGSGEAIARRLARDGHHVVMTDIDGASLDAAADAIAAAGGVCEARRLDVTNPSAVRALFVELEELDGCVNNAGLLLRSRFLDTDETTLHQLWEVNVVGTFLCGQAAAAQMVSRGRGAIVNLASLSAHRGRPGFSAYAATKGAVLALTRAMASELSPFGIRVNSVSPGVIRTAMNADWLSEPGVAEAAAEAMPMRRLGEAADVADAVAFLLSDESRWITGTDLIVDGGERGIGQLA